MFNISLTDSEGSLPGPNTGIPGIDYPVYSEIPKTDFNCKDQRYKGFFGDPGTDCQVWHYCDLNGGHASFLCPNGTIFSQVSLSQFVIFYSDRPHSIADVSATLKKCEIISYDIIDRNI